MSKIQKRYFVQTIIAYMSYSTCSTNIEQLDKPTLKRLETSSSTDLVLFLCDRNAEFITLCLYELYAHGEGTKLLEIWEDPIIQAIMEVDCYSPYPLSLYGLMLKTIVSFCELEMR